VLTYVRSFLGEDAVKKLFYQKENRLYLSSQFVQCGLREFFAQQPNALNYGSRPSIMNKRCEAGNAAISLESEDIIDDKNVDKETLPCDSEIASSAMGFASREARINVSAAEKFNRIVKEVITCCEKFEIKIAEMFPRLETVQDEFIKMCSEEVLASVYDQASKALEWAMICLDITDLIFDTRQSTFCRVLNFSAGINV